MTPLERPVAQFYIVEREVVLCQVVEKLKPGQLKVETNVGRRGFDEQFGGRESDDDSCTDEDQEAKMSMMRIWTWG